VEGQIAVAVDPRSPCIIGVGERTWRWSGEPAPEPLQMWEGASRAAGDDAGTQRALAELDSVQIVYCQSWQYDDPPSRLAERLGASPKHRFYSGIGGTTPQVLVSDAATRILRGEADLALITGAEALETIRQLAKRGERPRWSHKHPSPPPFPFPDPFHPAEVAHEVFQAWLTFPVFDVSRRANTAAPDEYRRRLGELLAPMTAIAARNPHAWFPNERSAEELITATPQNRMVGYPYTKYMVSIMDVDMAAGVILASHEKADALRIPAEKRVYLRGWCYAKDPVYLAERENLSASDAMRAASAEALRTAGVGIDDVSHFDLYSCFTSSINLTRDALGISEGDPRPVTVTGGLPFAGGAGSNYMSHSIAAMTETLRADPGSFGMVSGVGMHMVKHNFALYSTDPGRVQLPEEATVQRRLDAIPRRAIRNEYSGPATVATYTVAHARGGEPEWGLAICDIDAGGRCYARVHDPDLLGDIERTEWVGSKVEVATEDGKRNLVKP
jgi:acetyl-CoA C-acetyltransferase